MGERGPLPFPAKTRAARGTKARDRSVAKTTAPDIPVEAPTCPDFIKGEAKREWTRVVAELKDQRRLAKSDRSMLVAHCTAWARFVAVEEELTNAETNNRSSAWIDTGSKGQQVRAPLVDLWKMTHERVMATSAALGLNVGARLRLPIAPEKREQDPFDQEFGSGSSSTG